MKEIGTVSHTSDGRYDRLADGVERVTGRPGMSVREVCVGSHRSVRRSSARPPLRVFLVQKRFGRNLLMKIFVAGGTGAIGHPLIRQLLARGHTVAALTRSPEKAQALVDDGIEPAIADVFDAEAV